MKQFEIELNNGVINSKSRFNFKVFNALLDTNVRYSLLLFLLKQVGMEPNLETNSIEINDEEKFRKFDTWITEKLQYQQKIATTVQVEAV